MQVFDGLLNQTDSSPDHVRQLYDEWADSYDKNLRDWGYEAPALSARYAFSHAAPDAVVLDVGCGTGLSGAELNQAGFSTIDGVDFSADSVMKAAARGVYRQVSTIDLLQLPTGLPTAGYSALVCVGVLSYLSDTEATCREFCRLTQPGAPIVMTQRSDLFEERNMQAALDAITNDGLWQQIEVTGDKPYLPGNPDFVGVGVRYCIFRRL